MTTPKLEDALRTIFHQFSLDPVDSNFAIYGLDNHPKYNELVVDFYKHFNKFEAVFIQNDENHLFELFHVDNARILYQAGNIATTQEMKNEIKGAGDLLQEYTGYRIDHPIVRLSDIEKEKNAQKRGRRGIYIGDKFIPNRRKIGSRSSRLFR